MSKPIFQKTLLAGVLAFAFTAPAMAYNAPNKGGFSQVPEISLNLKGQELSVRLHEVQEIDLSQYLTVTKRGDAPQDLDKVQWAVFTDNVPDGLTVEGSKVKLDSLQAPLYNASLNVTVSYGGRSTQASFRLKDNGPELDANYIRSITLAARDGNLDSFTVEGEESAQQTAKANQTLPPVEMIKGEGRKADTFVLNNASLKVISSQRGGSGKAFAKYGPVSKEACQTVVRGIGSRPWANLGVIDPDGTKVHKRVDSKITLGSRPLLNSYMGLGPALIKVVPNNPNEELARQCVDGSSIYVSTAREDEAKSKHRAKNGKGATKDKVEEVKQAPKAISQEMRRPGAMPKISTMEKRITTQDMERAILEQVEQSYRHDMRPQVQPLKAEITQTEVTPLE